MNRIKSGFTLIELLVVIAVLGVLAAAVVIAINPVQKINQANDAKVKNDVAQIATAAQSYFTVNQFYPNTIGDLQTAGELTIAPTAPTGYNAYTLNVSPAGCTTASKTCTNIAVGGQVKAPAVVTNNTWCFHTNTGIAAEATTCTAP